MIRGNKFSPLGASFRYHDHQRLEILRLGVAWEQLGGRHGMHHAWFRYRAGLFVTGWWKRDSHSHAPQKIMAHE